MVKIDWHAGFVSAIKLELREYDNYLTYEEEHYIANRAQRLDLLIIKNNALDVIGNPIARIFGKFNIFEYKGIGDTLSYGDFYKTLAYTSLYLYEKKTDETYSADSYTMTFVRNSYPRKLIAHLQRDGITCTEYVPGYISVEGAIFKTQILITGRMAPGENIWLKSLTDSGTKNDLNYIISRTAELDKKYRDEADNVMDVFASANSELMQIVDKEEEAMCEAIEQWYAKRHKEEFEEMNRQLANINEELANKDEELANKAEELANKAEELANKDEELANKDAVINSLLAENARLKEKLGFSV